MSPLCLARMESLLPPLRPPPRTSRAPVPTSSPPLPPFASASSPPSPSLHIGLLPAPPAPASSLPPPSTAPASSPRPLPTRRPPPCLSPPSAPASLSPPSTEQLLPHRRLPLHPCFPDPIPAATERLVAGPAGARNAAGPRSSDHQRPHLRVSRATCTGSWPCSHFQRKQYELWNFQCIFVSFLLLKKQLQNQPELNWDQQYCFTTLV